MKPTIPRWHRATADRAIPTYSFLADHDRRGRGRRGSSWERRNFASGNHGDGLPVVLRLCQPGHLDLTMQLVHDLDDLLQRRAEELLSHVHHVDPAMMERVMKRRLQFRSIHRPDHGVHVEIERD